MGIPSGQIFVIGDSHIGLAPGSDVPMVAWLERLQALSPRALYLNGDLFHYLIAHPKFVTAAVESVFARFRRLREAGTEIHYVEGNRDFFLRGSFAEAAVTDVANEYAFSAGHRRYLIVHGDMINDRDYPYRFWRRASKNPISKFSIRLIPKQTARRFVDGVEQRLARSNFKHKSRLPVEQMTRYADRRAREGVTDIVFGHFHEKVILPGEKATVTVLPAWFDNQEAMVIDPQRGDFSFARI